MNQINNSKKIYQAAIYVRLSKEDGDVATAGKRESNSISNQKDLIKNFLKDKKDIVVVSERVDDGYSGSNFERPAFKRLIEDVKKKKINWKHWLPFYIMFIPGLIYMIVNNYMPLYGMQLAFKSFSYSKGIAGSKWIGFKNFKLTNVSENDTRFENKSTFTNNFDSIFKTKLHRLSLSKDAVVVLPKDANFADTTSTITLNEDSSDDNNTVATISYSYGNHTIGTAPVLYSEVSNKISVNATVTPEESTTVDTETSVDSENSNNSSKVSDKDTTKKTTKKETVSKSHFKFSSAIFKIIIIAVILVILAVIIIFFKKKMDHLNAVRASKRRRNR